ncbi:hypothetical protein N7471_006164 [Penicillium samsonianum]|uniref:uncharacterized protein n=1 Tax=Penicillium samsonianum TaxID=1882272 RepID=UPI0025468A9A|nr:uncharacterized protein N7471_006164 [Penicillium samsonianum]KAJ6139678.1 hypothetical protein N7471_006164 [Penicillium samsonianum]
MNAGSEQKGKSVKRILTGNGTDRISKSSGKNFLPPWMHSLKNVSSKILKTSGQGICSASLWIQRSPGYLAILHGFSRN